MNGKFLYLNTKCDDSIRTHEKLHWFFTLNKLVLKPTQVRWWVIYQGETNDNFLRNSANSVRNFGIRTNIQRFTLFISKNKHWGLFNKNIGQSKK